MVSNIREAVPRSLFWAPNRLNESREVRFEFPFILIGQSIVYFFNRPIMARTQILEAPNKDFGAFSQKNQPELSFIRGAGYCTAKLESSLCLVFYKTSKP